MIKINPPISPTNLLVVAFLLFGQMLFSQQKFTISGKVTSLKDNETIFGVDVLVAGKNIGVTTNSYGFYSLTLAAGEYTLMVSYLGFSSIKKDIVLNASISQDFALEEEAQKLEEVVISAEKEAEIARVNVKKPQMGVNAMTSEMIKKMPALFGQPDVIRSLLFLPGVSNGGDISSGFNVRGGGADQNLVLFDEAIIFTTSHIYGLLSVFNPEAVKDATLYKSATPARYGGRASSVLEIVQKNGNSKDFKMAADIGNIAANLTLEVPVVKDKSSILIAGRRSFLDLFMPKGSSIYFYDLNTKFNYQFNRKHALYVSGYFGRDLMSFNNVFNNDYGNTLVNVRYNHLLSDKLFANLSLIYSDYFYGFKITPASFSWKSGIANYNIKYDLKHYISTNFKMEYGINNIYYQFDPGEIVSTNPNAGVKSISVTKNYANEFAAYVGAEHLLSDKLALTYGLRLSYFVRLKQNEVNVYADNNPLLYDSNTQLYTPANPTGKEKPTGPLAQYINPEPRVALSYTINESSSVKASYNRMAQYLQTLSNTTIPSPIDVWIPSGKYLKPIRSDQYSIGYFRNFGRKYSLELETYYKELHDKVDYIDGADLLANNAIEGSILNGKGRAYGLEILFRKNIGKLTGMVSYTLSRSEQRTQGRTSEEVGVNEGKWYRSPYDRLHNLAATASYAINDSWFINANFVFQTGRAVTYPVGKYIEGGIDKVLYGERNKGSLPTYHRLDISASYRSKKNKTRKLKRELVFGVYNLYNRENSAYLLFSKNATTQQNEILSGSILPIIPFVSYNLRF